VERFIAIYLERTKCDPSLAPNSKLRREIAVKAIIKTWPALPSRDARRLSVSECQTWAAKAAAQGTGFIAPNAKPFAPACPSPRTTNASIPSGRSSR